MIHKSPNRVNVGLSWLPINPKSSPSQPTNFTLVFSDLHVYTSMFSVVLMNYIFMDGKCDYFQGDRPSRGCCGTWGIPVFPGIWDGGLLGSSACWGFRRVVILEFLVEHLGTIPLQQLHFPFKKGLNSLLIGNL